jgi:hypothetical protein
MTSKTSSIAAAIVAHFWHSGRRPQRRISASSSAASGSPGESSSARLRPALFGLLAAALSLRAALAIGVGLFTFAAVVLTASPVRSLRQVPVHPAYAEA